MAISPIFQNVAQTATPANTAAADPRASTSMSAAEQVGLLYLRDLNRLPDPAGQAFWEQRATQISPAQLNQEFRAAAQAENPQAGIPAPRSETMSPLIASLRDPGLTNRAAITLPGEVSKGTSFLELAAPFIIPAIAIVAPALIPSIGSALLPAGASAAAINAAGSAVINAGVTAAQGGDFGDILKSGVAGAAGGYAGTTASEAVKAAEAAGKIGISSSLPAGVLPAAAGGAAGTGARTLVETGDVGRSLQAAGLSGLASGAGQAASVTAQGLLPADTSRTTQALVAGGAGGATEAAIEGANPITGAIGSALQTARVTSAMDADAARRAEEARRQQVISAFEQPTTPSTQFGTPTAELTSGLRPATKTDIEETRALGIDLPTQNNRLPTVFVTGVDDTESLSDELKRAAITGNVGTLREATQTGALPTTTPSTTINPALASTTGIVGRPTTPDRTQQILNLTGITPSSTTTPTTTTPSVVTPPVVTPPITTPPVVTPPVTPPSVTPPVVTPSVTKPTIKTTTPSVTPTTPPPPPVDTKPIKVLFGLGTSDPSAPGAAAFGGATNINSLDLYSIFAIDMGVKPSQVIEEILQVSLDKNIVDPVINKIKNIEVQAVMNQTTPQEIVRNIYVEDLNNAKNVVAEASKAVNLPAGGATEGATGISGEAGGRLGPTNTTPSTSIAATDTSLIPTGYPYVVRPDSLLPLGEGTTGSRDQSILDLTGIRSQVGGTQTDTTGTGAASGAGAGAATGTGTGAGVTGDGSGAGVSGFGPGAGGTGTGTGRGVGAGEGEGGGTPGKTEDETKKITEDTLTPTITRPPIIDDPTRIIDYRYFNVVDPTFSAPPLTTTTMGPGSSALAQALGVGDPGVSYLSKKGKERKPVWNVESLKLSDELGGRYG